MPKRDLYTKAEMLLREYMGMHRLRNTEERWIILRYIVENTGRFTASDVVGWVQPHFISRATVYNVLKTMEEAHIIHCLHAQHSGRLMEYELTIGERNSMQIICTRCGRVANVTGRDIQTAIRLKNYPNFIMRHYSVYVFGECKECKKLSKPQQL